METFSALMALCAGNSTITGEFPSQRPVTRSFDVFFHLRLKKIAWVNNREAGDLRRHHAHYDVIVMKWYSCACSPLSFNEKDHFRTGLKLENYYFFTFTFSRPEVRKLLLFYVFTFSRPEVRKLFRIYVFTFSRPEVGKLFRIYVFTFSRPEVRKLFRIYVFTFSRPEVGKLFHISMA